MSHFSLGAGTYQVPFAMHAQNRKSLLENLAKLGVDASTKGIVLLQGGEAKNSYDTDHEPLFRQESNINYLFGVKEPDCWGIIETASKRATLLIPRLPPAYATWMGKILPPSHYQALYEVDDCRYTDELSAVVASLNPDKIFVNMGVNTDSGNKPAVTTFEGIEKYAVDDKLLNIALAEARVIKSEEEIKLMRHVANVSSQGHVHVMRQCKPGMKEYQLESLFLHYCYFNHGCRETAYTCIVGSGDNSSILHYGHAAAPNEKQLDDGDLMLLDMGVRYHGYSSDITCSFPSNGKFTEAQKKVYNIVLEANQSVMREMGPGVAWPEMHVLAERVVLKGLVDMGILKGDVDEMMDVYLGATFMPHGLGHFLGLDTHDVGGYPEGVVRASRPGLKSLRAGRKLEKNMVITVEPGLYFIDHLIDEALASEEKAKFIVKEELEKMRGFGGVRIEDDVLVRGEKGGDCLSALCPRSVEDIEHVMAGGEWPRK